MSQGLRQILDPQFPPLVFIAETSRAPPIRTCPQAPDETVFAPHQDLRGIWSSKDRTASIKYHYLRGLRDTLPPELTGAIPCTSRKVGRTRPSNIENKAAFTEILLVVGILTASAEATSSLPWA